MGTMKGFGFINPDDEGPDVFVHQTEIKAEGFRSLADGEPVEYIPETDAQGRIKATKVTGPGGKMYRVHHSDHKRITTIIIKKKATKELKKNKYIKTLGFFSLFK